MQVFFWLARFYSVKKWLRFIKQGKKKLALLPKGMAIFYCICDKDTPASIRWILMGALGYVLLPFDIIPDFFGTLGWVDDLVVVTMVFRYAEHYIKPEHIKKAKRWFPFSSLS
ncbi:hypothetical protein CAL30_00350 [Megasphaera hutchinsoni]|jgi:hypothetical protein|uniref:DUF1232 domain-containing protein n=1 Tax=Megasphaera hutchinsoni TaxID=1588748 RepID=A0A2J8BCH9_9FIRM|nr:YkvA family protein [Megasphaera genomosp. type_2]PNH22451.1 hypothetical protein CAL30_00350 [Megasphaera genomosp. type_2]